MIPYEVAGIRVEIGAPVLVGSREGHLWFPTLHPFERREAGAGPARDILCLGAIADDKAQGSWPGALYLSRDGGASWAPAGEIACCGPASVALATQGALADHGAPELGRRLLMPYELWPLAPGERRDLIAQGTVLALREDGALSAAPAPVRFGGFPADLADYHEGELLLLTNGNILPLADGRLFTTLYGVYAGEERYRLLAVTSADGGFTWRYHALVASWQDIPSGPEGPCESHTARLADGRLLCVYRVGSGRDYPYHKSLSADEGLSWSAPRPLRGAWSVEPQLIRLEGDPLASGAQGILLLSGGRHGLFLWVCADGLGERWEPINLAEHHNACLPDPSLHFGRATVEARERVEPAQSTAYTGMIRVSAGEALLCYDRLGNGWRGAPGPWGPRDMLFCLRLRVGSTGGRAMLP